MRLLESKEQLQAWEEYREFLKLQLKRINKEEVLFVSKNKLDFDLDGRIWKGYAVLTGPKVPQCVRKLKKFGIRFEEGKCQRKGRDLLVDPESLKSRYLREAEKTVRKLRLGYNFVPQKAAASPQ